MKFMKREIPCCPLCGATDEETLQLLETRQHFDDEHGEVISVPIGWTIQCVQCGITMSDEYLDLLLETWGNPAGSLARAAAHG